MKKFGFQSLGRIGPSPKGRAHCFESLKKTHGSSKKMDQMSHFDVGGILIKLNGPHDELGPPGEGLKVRFFDTHLWFFATKEV